MLWIRKGKIKNTSEKLTMRDNEVDPFVIDYVNSQRDYFSALLGNRILSKNNISKNDVAVLKEAYDKAHQIRNIEIDLYWKRATYCWTLIAALLTICGLLFSVYFRSNNSDNGDNSIFIAIGAVSFLGVVITSLCQFMSVSGEYWKKNWETHISMLEPMFSGRLYSTHLVSSRYRSSIAKLNFLLFSTIQISWLVIIMALITIKFQSKPELSILSIILFGAIYLILITLLTIGTVSKNKSAHVFITDYNIIIHDKFKISEQLSKISIRLLGKLVLAIVLLIVLFLCTWIFFRFGLGIDASTPIVFWNKLFQ
ncbi:hypothetical protein [Pectobacterium polaris]|uniref:RipA family octameric membrane protein n=1 Tax=Pectobacterium polaris TaxID=2042057 RepID=UPI001968C72E|nr:hypothetical protein [Pectobacterium polaris]MBN3214605.1 hypothetical protein [Pectobacterium polaris]MDG0801079.1 hypothetical protein [Pectobacterium polaris]